MLEFHLSFKIHLKIASTFKIICSLGLLKELEMLTSFTQNMHGASVEEDGEIQELVIAAQHWEEMRSGISLAFEKCFRCREFKALFLL